MAVGEPDSNQVFFDTTTEAVQVQLELSEKAFGIDTLLEAADEEEIEGSAVDGLSDDEMELYVEQGINSDAIPRHIEVGLMVVGVERSIDVDADKPNGFTLLYVAIGHALLNKHVKLEDGRLLEKVVQVDGDGTSTKIVQARKIHNFTEGAKRTHFEPDEVDITLEDINNYLTSYVTAARALLALDAEEIRSRGAEISGIKE